MTTATKTVEILGEFINPHGEFERALRNKLVKRDGKHYVIAWEFTGLDSLWGGAARPYLYDVRASQLDEILPYFTPGSDVCAADFGHNVLAILEWRCEIQMGQWAWDYIK